MSVHYETINVCYVTNVLTSLKLFSGYPFSHSFAVIIVVGSERINTQQSSFMAANLLKPSVLLFYLGGTVTQV